MREDGVREVQEERLRREDREEAGGTSPFKPRRLPERNFRISNAKHAAEIYLFGMIC